MALVGLLPPTYPICLACLCYFYTTNTIFVIQVQPLVVMRTRWRPAPWAPVSASSCTGQAGGGCGRTARDRRRKRM